VAFFHFRVNDGVRPWQDVVSLQFEPMFFGCRIKLCRGELELGSVRNVSQLDQKEALWSQDASKSRMLIWRRRTAPLFTAVARRKVNGELG